MSRARAGSVPEVIMGKTAAKRAKLWRIDALVTCCGGTA
jgi:hypothetical protein